MEFHEIANKFPMMSHDELTELSSDIAKNGLVDPIVLFEGKILDGRNRYVACELAGVDPAYSQFDGEDPWTFVWSKNAERRHLTSSQIAAISPEFERHFAEEAKERQKLSDGRGQKGSQIFDYLNNNEGKAAEITAKSLGTNRQYVADAKKLEREAPALLEKVKTGELTIPQAKRELVKQNASEPQQIPTDKYRVIYADPPWSYNDKCDEGSVQSGGAEKHYPSMSIEQLCLLPIKDIAEENAVLFLWTTSPLLFECYPIIGAWGFKYKASFVWDKVKHNMGHYNSVRHEFLLICTRGSCVPDSSELIDSVQSIERGEHSSKPEEFRAIIDKLYTHGNKIELFARRQSAGWDRWGNEC